VPRVSERSHELTRRHASTTLRSTSRHTWKDILGQIREVKEDGEKQGRSSVESGSRAVDASNTLQADNEVVLAATL